MTISALPRKAHALAALVLLVMGACGKEVGLGEGGVSVGGGSATGSVGGGADIGCASKACGAYCRSYGKDGWCNGTGFCASQYLCGPDDPCAGKTCGEACAPCDTSEPAAACPDDGLLFACDLDGKCRPSGFSCGPCDPGAPDCPYDPCLAQNLPCGTPCYPGCDPADENCLAAASMVCNAEHQCLPELQVKCDPCMDEVTQRPKLCGQECLLCKATPWLACDRPFSPSGITVCDGSGACVAPEQQFTACQGSPDWEPCASSTCGASCTLCDPKNDPGCYPDQQLQCNADQQCVGAALCTYGCAGLSCGDPCFPCDPDDGCEPKFCDAYLGCVLDAPEPCP